MSCGFEEPSISASPARTRSPSCTLMCLPFGIRYSFGSAPARSGVAITRRLPRESGPNEIVPSISETIAKSFGLRASNSSATRGRPPVMSFVLVVSRGIFASTSPAATSWPSVTARFAPTGSSERAIVALLASLIETRGRSSGSLDSMITFDESPVNSSTCSFIVAPSTMSPNFTVPDTSERIGIGERVPLDQHGPGLHALAVVHAHVRAVDDRVALALAARRVEDPDLARCGSSPRAGPRGRARCAGS